MKTLGVVLTEALAGPSDTTHDRLKTELRDFFAHEIMTYHYKHLPKRPRDQELQRLALYGFFNHVFKSTPAMDSDTDRSNP